MLIKAEKTLTQDEYLIGRSPDEILRMVKGELARQMINEMFENSIIKVEMVHDRHDNLGDVVKVRLTARAYNPDD